MARKKPEDPESAQLTKEADDLMDEARKKREAALEAGRKETADAIEAAEKDYRVWVRWQEKRAGRTVGYVEKITAQQFMSWTDRKRKPRPWVAKITEAEARKALEIQNAPGTGAMTGGNTETDSGE